MIRLYFLISIIIFNVCALKAQTSCPMDIGTNFHFFSADVYKDMKLSSSKFYTRNDVYLDDGNDWDSNLIDSIQTDDDGYPLQVPFSYPISTSTDQIVAFTVGGHEMAYDTGRHVMLFDGEGQFNFVEWTYTTIDSIQEGRIVFTVDSVTENGIHIELLQTSDENHVRNIRIIKAEHEHDYLLQPYRSGFMNRAADFTTFRFMDWSYTNDHQISNWDERITPDYHTQENYLKGMAWEYMIEMANDFHKDIWINVPHLVENEYIDSMATLFRDLLDPELTIHLEFSNECWNWIFEQTHWLNESGPFVGEIGKNYGYYSLRVFDRWDAIFSGQESRIKTVLAGHDYFVIDAMDYILSQGKGDLVDNMSYPGYVGLNDDDYDTLDVYGNSSTADMILDMLESNMEESFYWMQQFKTLCPDAYGKDFVIYEGGQHITPRWFGLDTSYNQALYDAQIHPRMYDFYTELLRYFRDSLGVTLFMNYVLASPQESSFGSWGLLENYDSSAPWPPKYQSTIDFMNGCSMTTNTGIVLSSESITIYPNPVEDEITIDGVEGQFQVLILNVLGQIIQDHSADHLPLTIDVSTLVEGPYFLALINDQNPLIYLETLIKQ